MALKARLKAEDHAKLSDALKAEYTKGEDGTFTLAVEEVDGLRLDNTDALRKAVGAERARADGAESKLKADLKLFEGLDAAKARDALKRLEAIDAGEPDDKTKRKIESLTAQLTEKHQAEISPLKQALDEAAKEIDSLTVDHELARAVARVKLIDGGAELLISQAKAKGLVRRVKGADGKSAVRVFGDDGVEMVTREAGKSGNATVDELVSVVLKKQYPGLYVESTKSGGGADAGDKRGKSTSGNETVSGARRLESALTSGGA